MKKDLRIEIVKSLQDKKMFRLYWQDSINKSVDLEAVDEQDAEDKFNKGDIDWENCDEGNVNFVDGTLEIEEVHGN